MQHNEVLECTARPAMHDRNPVLCPDPDHWEIFWCHHAWQHLRESTAKKLPFWASIRTLDPSKPIASQVGNASVLIPTTGPVDGDTIRAAKRCKLIAQPAAGYENIDMAAAVECGIPVTHGPGINSASVAEAALMTILMLARKAVQQQEVFRQRGVGHPMGTQLAGKTLGIIGMGGVGCKLARTAEAMDIIVIGTRSASSRHDLEALLRAADIISLHCPLTEATRNILGAEELAMCKRGVLIVNYARGDCIDQQALTEALKSGQVGGVGLDVHWVEPADPSEEIYQLPNVLALPHTGTSTHEVFEEWSALLVENIIRIHDGRMADLLHRLV